MRTSAISVFLALVTAGGAASADPRKECAAAAEDAQDARAQGQLKRARAELIECARDACPGVVRRDCANWSSEVEKLLPTLAIAARDTAGNDVPNASVYIDEKVAEKELDGRSMAVDPGIHFLRVEAAGFKPAEQRVVVREGEKARPVTMTLEPIGAATPPPAPPATPGNGSQPGDAHANEAPRGHSLAPWIVVIVGGVAVVTGVALYVDGRAQFPSTCNRSDEKCDPIPGESPASAQARLSSASSSTTLATDGVYVAIGGAVVVIAGLVWHFVEPTGPRQASLRLTPSIVARGAGTGIELSF